MNTYNPAYDYVSAHLAYASSHPNFVPKGITIATTYYDVLAEQYIIESFNNTPLDVVRQRKNKLAWICFKSDLAWVKERKLIEESLTMISEPQIKESFITIGFNHQTFNIKKCLALVKTVLGLSIVLDGSFGVMENFRANGEHPHVHFKVFHNKETCKGALVQTIERAKNAKKYITNRNFIDVKPFMDYHNQYLEGNKTAEKLPYVAKDRLWRAKNNIPDKVFKEVK